MDLNGPIVILHEPKSEDKNPWKCRKNDKKTQQKEHIKNYRPFGS